MTKTYSDLTQAKAVIAQLEKLIADNDKQHAQMVNGATHATSPNSREFFTGMQAAYAHYGDGLRDAMTVIRSTFKLGEEK